jgi:hypothetical protein
MQQDFDNPAFGEFGQVDRYELSDSVVERVGS